MGSRIKSIEIALENELRERDFYLKQSRKTDNPFGKEMFAQLAKEEEEHYEMLKSVYSTLIRSGVWPETLPAVVNDTDVKEMVKNMPNLADLTVTSNADDIVAVQLSIRFEKEAHQFYSRLQENAEHAGEKKVFAYLAQIEWDHAQSLETSLAFFEDPRAWDRDPTES